MGKKKITGQRLTGERAAYGSVDTEFIGCIFEDGESPLKECRNISVERCTFGWKYPLWYCRGAKVKNSVWKTMGRSGVWYTKDLVITDSDISAPKQFRRCEDLTVTDSNIPDAIETLWDCKNVRFKNVEIGCGDYFGMNCKNVELDGVRIDGNYCFDGAENVTAKNCVFNSRDAFWNCKNVVVRDSVINGEYIGWNSENLTFINCKIESHQAFCYIKGLKLVGCELTGADLCFELCSDIDAELTNVVDSIKNPISGVIRCKGIGELILDESVIDPAKTVIEVDKNGAL